MPDVSGLWSSRPDGRVVSMKERPEQPVPGLINGGVYWVNRDKLMVAIPEDRPSSLERESLPALAAAGRLAGRAYDGCLHRHRRTRRIRAGASDCSRSGAAPSSSTATARSTTTRDIPTGAMTFGGSSARQEAIRAVNDAGLFAFVITNQSGVCARSVHRGRRPGPARMDGRAVALLGAHIDAFSYCPHHPEGNVVGYDRRVGAGSRHRA